jgi:hypothetical protein
MEAKIKSIDELVGDRLVTQAQLAQILGLLAKELEMLESCGYFPVEERVSLGCLTRFRVSQIRKFIEAGGDGGCEEGDCDGHL